MFSLLWVLTWGGCLEQGGLSNVYQNDQLIAAKIDKEEFPLGNKLSGHYAVTCIRDNDESVKKSAAIPKLAKPGFAKIVSDK